MFFNQKSHPLHFASPTEFQSKAGVHLLQGKRLQVEASCYEVAPFCTRLSLRRKDLEMRANPSDGILPQYRKPKCLKGNVSKSGVEFQGGQAQVSLGASTIKVSLPGVNLSTVEEGIGFNGEQTLFRFKTTGMTGFYGFGERTKGFNKSGDSLDFWTVDVVAVFPHAYQRDDYDPAYVSIPLAIVRQNGAYAGIYFDNPYRLIMDIGKTYSNEMLLQSLQGTTDLYFIAGPTLRDVVRNFVELTGRGEMPPVWSMGYHQCRWGYQHEEDFYALQKNFEKHQIPVSVFWCDIDYMNEYRVFTWDKKDIPNPKKMTDFLKKKDISLVTIVDPGVKQEKGYEVYDSGKKKDVFCKAASGKDYVGSVWPGDTVFPDFTLEKARDWWAEWMKKFMKESGVAGAWLDMNDPSTGWSRAEDMLFKDGTVEHEAYHNQYAHYMAMASREGFEKLDPQMRPFLLTRSAYTGTHRYSAVWTGDNGSNWKHLRMSIPCTLNLGLSGVGFNGPDVGGFMGDTNEELLVRWFQAGFLFPFFRNHSCIHTKTQEPWEFGPNALGHIKNIIETRYRLMPYLYQCFFQNHLTGDPIMRPLLYEFEDSAFENITDQYLMGDRLMAAPIVYPAGECPDIVKSGVKYQIRNVNLPQGWWFDLHRNEWIEGGRIVEVTAHMGETPLFVRDGSIIPYYQGKLQNAKVDLHDVEFHVFSKKQGACLDYLVDDFKTRKYLKGEYETLKVEAGVFSDKIVVETSKLSSRFKLKVNVVVYGAEVREIQFNGVKRKAKKSTRRWVGADLPVSVFA